MTRMTTNANQAIANLGEVALINLDFHIWSGQTKMVKEDYDLGTDGKLPPEKVAELGNKKIAPQSALKPFRKLKERCRRHLLEVGLPMAGMFAIPLDRLERATKTLDAICEEYENEKGRFLADYDQSIADWIKENPKEADIIRRGVKSVNDVAHRIAAGYQVFQMTPVAGAQEGLERAAGGLSSSLVQEIQEEFKGFYKERFFNKSPAHLDRRTRAVWEKYAKKVASLTFLDSRLDSLEALLTSVVDIYKRSPKVVGADLAEIKTAAVILSSERIYDYLDGDLDDFDFADDQDDFWATDDADDDSAVTAPSDAVAAPTADVAEDDDSSDAADAEEVVADAAAEGGADVDVEENATEASPDAEAEVDTQDDEDVDSLFSEMEGMLDDVSEDDSDNAVTEETAEKEETLAARSPVSSYDPDADEAVTAEDDEDDDVFF